MCCGDVAGLVHRLISPPHHGPTHPPHEQLLARLGTGGVFAGEGRVLVVLVLSWSCPGSGGPGSWGLGGVSDMAGMQGSWECLLCRYPP